MDLFEVAKFLFGAGATVVGPFIMFPQVRQMWRTKSVSDLSWGSLRLYFLNCFLWLGYGAFLADYPLMIANSIAMGFSIAQIVMKAAYSKIPERQSAQ
jgi:MtN3 and saliva related transmembrane protein